jgi:hypothetical protein
MKNTITCSSISEQIGELAWIQICHEPEEVDLFAENTDYEEGLMTIFGSHTPDKESKIQDLQKLSFE